MKVVLQQQLEPIRVDIASGGSNFERGLFTFLIRYNTLFQHANESSGLRRRSLSELSDAADRILGSISELRIYRRTSSNEFAYSEKAETDISCWPIGEKTQMTTKRRYEHNLGHFEVLNLGRSL